MTTRKRRDPRAERNARRGGDLAEPVSAEAGETGRLVRRDPRAERDARRGLVAAARPSAAKTARDGVAPSVKVIEDPAFWVLVLADMPDGRLSPHDRDVLGAARGLADRDGDGGVVVLAPAVHEELGAAGVDRAVKGGTSPSSYEPERMAAMAGALVDILRPRHVLAPETPIGAGDVARRLAAARGLRVAARVFAIEADSISCRADGGVRDIVRTPGDVMLLMPETGEPHRGPAHEARSLDAPEITVASRLDDDGAMPIDTSAVALAEADFIVSAGNGVTDWAAFHDVAAALGAVEGGSRVVCDTGQLPRDRQVGASGTLVEPRCYLAFGIAGAPQHLQGIERCERVVAINTDLHADMVKRADLAIIQDAQLVMPALAARVRGEVS